VLLSIAAVAAARRATLQRIEDERGELIEAHVSRRQRVVARELLSIGRRAGGQTEYSESPSPREERRRRPRSALGWRAMSSSASGTVPTIEHGVLAQLYGLWPRLARNLCWQFSEQKYSCFPSCST
jgi:hypothetical protein